MVAFALFRTGISEMCSPLVSYAEQNCLDTDTCPRQGLRSGVLQFCCVDRRKLIHPVSTASRSPMQPFSIVFETVDTDGGIVRVVPDALDRFGNSNCCSH